MENPVKQLALQYMEEHKKNGKPLGKEAFSRRAGLSGRTITRLLRDEVPTSQKTARAIRRLVDEASGVFEKNK